MLREGWVEHQQSCLVRSDGRWVMLPRRALAPGLREGIDHRAHTEHLFGGGAEVKGRAEMSATLDQSAGQREVATERFEHMLPRPHRGDVPHRHRLPRSKGPGRIDDQTIFVPVAPADHVAGAGAGNGRGTFVEEGAAVGTGHDLRRGFAGAVRVMPAQRIHLTIRIDPLAILVAFVGGHDHHAQQRRNAAAGLQHIRSPHGIRRKGGHGFAVTLAHQCLRRHVNDNGGGKVADERCEGLAIADIARAVVADCREVKVREHARLA